MTELEKWMAWRRVEDERLYQKYGKSLETEHTGEFAAIGPGGESIVGTDDTEVFRKGIDAFGSGNFGIFRIGHSTLETWLSIEK